MQKSFMENTIISPNHHLGSGPDIENLLLEIIIITPSNNP